MTNILVSIIPGLAFACAIFLLIIGFVQFRIYLKKSYKRSKYVSLFCIFAALFAFEHFMAQSRAFSPYWTHLYIAISTASLCLSLYYYMKSISYFVAVPNIVYRIYTGATFLLGMTVLVGVIIHFFFEYPLFFDEARSLETGNYFVNSYTMRIGYPMFFLDITLSFAGFITIVAALFMLRNVLKSSRDMYFVAGLLFSLVAAALENLLLPFTYAYFFPVVFMSNLFEAFRMNSLSYREYISELKEKVLKKNEAPDSEKYQNSNLTEQRIEELAKTLQSVLGNEKLYLNPNLSSEDLARKIGIPTYQLSQVVNIGLNTTFFELLSQCRIEEVKEKLRNSQYDHETIINIAYSSGFNSKSAFNTAFKKQTGLTPSAFRKG